MGVGILNHQKVQCDVLFIAGNSRSLIANRGDLIRDMQERGLRISAAIPSFDYLPETRRLGIDIHLVEMSRTSANPITDLKYFWELLRLLRQIQPRAVFSYTSKPVIYGSLAARLTRVPGRFAMITGLGHIYTTRNIKTRVVRPVMNFLYRFGASSNHKIFFQNPDDVQQFEDLGILRDRSKAVRTNGSGVDVVRFSQRPMQNKTPLFLFIGRLLTEKGIEEFVEAANQLRERWSGARFVAVGPHDPNLPHSIPEETVARWKTDSAVEFVGAAEDVRIWLAKSSVFVLPSYREGTPRSVLEALSTGRAVITTDSPGCRETVEHGVNGLLIKPQSVASLVEAMEYFLERPESVSEMAVQSRRIAEKKYEVRKVNQVILGAMEL